MTYYTQSPSPAYFHHPHTMQSCMLKVEGQGKVSVEPDIAEVSLGVSTTSIELATAQQKNAEIMTMIINSLTKMGIAAKDINTQSYTITPEYDYVEGKQVFRGYKVTHILKVTIRDIKRTGEIIDAAVQSGANIVRNISFTVSNPSIYYQQALTFAIDDALAKAKTIGRKLNVTLFTTPIQIVEKSKGVPYEPTLLKAAEATTPIQPGQITITAGIDAIYIYT